MASKTSSAASSNNKWDHFLTLASPGVTGPSIKSYADLYHLLKNDDLLTTSKEELYELIIIFLHGDIVYLSSARCKNMSIVATLFTLLERKVALTNKDTLRKLFLCFYTELWLALAASVSYDEHSLPQDFLALIRQYRAAGLQDATIISSSVHSTMLTMIKSATSPTAEGGDDKVTTPHSSLQELLRHLTEVGTATETSFKLAKSVILSLTCTMAYIIRAQVPNYRSCIHCLATQAAEILSLSRKLLVWFVRVQSVWCMSGDSFGSGSGSINSKYIAAIRMILSCVIAPTPTEASEDASYGEDYDASAAPATSHSKQSTSTLSPSKQQQQQQQRRQPQQSQSADGREGERTWTLQKKIVTSMIAATLNECASKSPSSASVAVSPSHGKVNKTGGVIVPAGREADFLYKAVCYTPVKLYARVVDSTFMLSKSVKVRSFGLVCIAAMMVASAATATATASAVAASPKGAHQHGNNTFWQHGSIGATVLRAIKTAYVSAYNSAGIDIGIRDDGVKEAVVDDCTSLLLDTAMLDTAAVVRTKVLDLIATLPLSLVTQRFYRVLVLKCRDKEKEVRTRAVSVVSGLGVLHAADVLTQQQLLECTSVLLQLLPQIFVESTSTASSSSFSFSPAANTTESRDAANKKKAFEEFLRGLVRECALIFGYERAEVTTRATVAVDADSRGSGEYKRECRLSPLSQTQLSEYFPGNGVPDGSGIAATAASGDAIVGTSTAVEAEAVAVAGAAAAVQSNFVAVSTLLRALQVDQLPTDTSFRIVLSALQQQEM